MDLLEGEFISGSGGGGKGGGGGHTPIEATDTLRSQQTVRLLLALSEGEITSIDDILLNKVSIASYNINTTSAKTSWDWRSGTASQSVVPGFINTEAPLSISTTVIQNADSITHVTKPVGSYSWTLDGTTDAVRLTLTLASLKRYLDNGDLVGYSASFDIYTKASLASAALFSVTSTKTGKASSNYSWDIVINRPATTLTTGSWQVIIVRTTADDSSVKLNSVCSLTAITQLYYKPLTYPNTALVYIQVNDAMQFGGQVPTVLVKGKGRKVLIPNNYNPTTRVYTGTWDLGMNPVKQFTANVAWVLYDVLCDSACLGIDQTNVDRVAFYQLSQYADQLVPDGYGTYIPRYTVGYQFFTRQNVQTFIQNLLSLCNASLTTNEFGQISIIFDQPNVSPSRLVTNSNVVGGIFNYSSNDLENRYSLVNVTYNNFKSYSETDTATWSDDSLITRYGLQTTDIILPGCLYEAQAIRKARWAVYTNAITTRLLTFNVGFEGLSYKTGSVIKVMDSDNADVVQHGIIKSSSLAGGTTTFIIDKTIALVATTYTITFYLSDATTLVTRTIIESNSSVNSVSFTGTDVPLIGSTFILSSTIVPQLYKVVGIKKNDTDYTISCVVYDNTKFTYIDGTVTLTTPTNDFVNVSNFSAEAVTNLIATPISSSNGITHNIQLHISWDWNLTNVAKYKASFEATWTRDNQDLNYVSNIQGQSFDINNAVSGIYLINVWSINPISGIKSPVDLLIYDYRSGTVPSTLYPPVNARVTGTAGLSFNTPALSLSFDYNTANNAVTVADTLFDYQLELWDSSGTTKYKTYIVKPDIAKNGLFNLPFAENVAVFGTATRTFKISIYSRDLTGFISSALSVVVYNSIPAIQSFNVISGVSSVFLNISTIPEPDITGYQVYRSNTTGFTPGVTADALSPIYDGPDTYITLNVPDTTTWYYKVAAYDSFGKTGLTFSSQSASTALASDAIRWTLSGIIFSIGTTNQLIWTAGTIVKSGSTNYSIVAGNVTWTTGMVYVYFNPAVSLTVLQTTTTLAIAVGVGCFPICTYTGGAASNIKGGDGSAFISGSQLIAGTVGASQIIAGSIVASLLDTTNAVITGTAQIGTGVITTANIADASITNAKIGSSIQSTNYNATTHLGWLLDKAGNITTYGTLNILDQSGNTILSSGANPAFGQSAVSAAVVTNANLVKSLNTWTLAGSTSISAPTAVNAQYAVNKVVGVIAGGSSGVFTSEVLNLATATDYTLSFTAWTNTAGDILQADLFPDTLPQFDTALSLVPTTYTYVFNSASADMASCQLRFFAGYATAITTNIRICNVKFEKGSTRTPWSPASADLVTTSNPITASNASTYIANLAVNTLQIAGNAITVPLAIYDFFGTNKSISLTTGVLSTTEAITLTVLASGRLNKTVSSSTGLVTLGESTGFNGSSTFNVNNNTVSSIYAMTMMHQYTLNAGLSMTITYSYSGSNTSDTFVDLSLVCIATKR